MTIKVYKPQADGNFLEMQCTCNAEEEFKRSWGSDPMRWPSFGWGHTGDCPAWGTGLVWVETENIA